MRSPRGEAITANSSRRASASGPQDSGNAAQLFNRRGSGANPTALQCMTFGSRTNSGTLSPSIIDSLGGQQVAAADGMISGYEADVMAGVGGSNPRAGGALGFGSSSSRRLSGAAGGGGSSSRRGSRDAGADYTPMRKGSKGGAGTPGSSGQSCCIRA